MDWFPEFPRTGENEPSIQDLDQQLRDTAICIHHWQQHGLFHYRYAVDATKLQHID